MLCQLVFILINRNQIQSDQRKSVRKKNKVDLTTEIKHIESESSSNGILTIYHM